MRLLAILFLDCAVSPEKRDEMTLWAVSVSNMYNLHFLLKSKFFSSVLTPRHRSAAIVVVFYHEALFEYSAKVSRAISS